ncbi:MAG: beta strand repeat-containing protein [Gemmobacter sp.]
MQFNVTGSGVVDLRATDLSTFDGLTFLTSGNTTAQINSSQIFPSLLVYEASAFRDIVEVFMTSATLNLSTLTLTNWGAGGDRFLIRDTAASNTITGTSGNDSIFVTQGSDTVDGGGGSDDILFVDYALDNGSFSMFGVDRFSDFSNTSIIHSNFERLNIALGSGNDSVVGGAGDDTMDGGAGNDTLNGGAGASTLRGGLGNDVWVADFTGQANARTINLNLGGNQSAGAGTFYQDFERLNFTGGSGNDVITTRTDNANDGLNDVLNGGLGNDTLTVGGGIDTVNGGDGDDLLIVDYATETSAVQTSGNNFSDFSNTTVNFTNVERFDVRGGSAGDSFATLGGDDSLSGGGGNDTLNSGTGAAVVNGGSGFDLWTSDFSGDGTAKVIDLSLAGVQNAGNGTTYTEIERLNFTGGSGDDVITTRTDNADDGLADSLNGGLGNDTLTVGGGLDTVNGGDGDDLLIVDYSTETFAVQTSGANFSDFSNTAVNFTNIERFDVRGGSAGDSFTTLGGDDSLSGGGGNDTLNSGTGAAVVNGGSGFDLWTSDFSGDGTAKVINLSLAGVQNAGNGTTYTEIERLGFTGGSGDDVITTRTDNANDGLGDTLNGGLGNDTLTVGGGIDNVNGGDGDDLLIVDYSTETSAVQTSGNNFSDFSNTTVSFTNIERFDVRGGSAGDSFATLGGDDTLSGGGGNDTLNGGGGNDRLVVTDAAGVVTMTMTNAGVATLTGAGIGTDLASNFEIFDLGQFNDTAIGNNSANRLIGNGGRDRLEGRGGNDTLLGGNQDDFLTGGGGQDVVTGGSGADVFIFAGPGELNRPESLADIITDFVSGIDRISLQQIDAIVGGANDMFTWVGTGPFTALGQVRYYDDGVDTYIAINTKDTNNIDYRIKLDGLVTLDATDFLL